MRGLVKGIVIHGDKLGRKLGYPTANLNWPRKKKISNGIYAAEVKLLKKDYQGVVVVGIPLVLNKKPKFEVHILNFNRNIYGKWLSVKIVKRIGELKKYKNNKLLKQAIRQDCQKTKNILSANKN